MLAEGITFMVIGMGTVLAFLSLLVLAMTCTSKLIATYFPPPPQSPSLSAPSSGDNDIAIVLAAAYRWRQGQGE